MKIEINKANKVRRLFLSSTSLRRSWKRPFHSVKCNFNRETQINSKRSFHGNILPLVRSVTATLTCPFWQPTTVTRLELCRVSTSNQRTLHKEQRMNNNLTQSRLIPIDFNTRRNSYRLLRFKAVHINIKSLTLSVWWKKPLTCLVNFAVQEKSFALAAPQTSVGSYPANLVTKLFNPLHPKISMHILHTAFYTFPKVLERRICLPIISFFHWWSFP